MFRWKLKGSPLHFTYGFESGNLKSRIGIWEDSNCLVCLCKFLSLHFMVCAFGTCFVIVPPLDLFYTKSDEIRHEEWFCFSGSL